MNDHFREVVNSFPWLLVFCFPKIDFYFSKESTTIHSVSHMHGRLHSLIDMSFIYRNTKQLLSQHSFWDTTHYCIDVSKFVRQLACFEICIKWDWRGTQTWYPWGIVKRLTCYTISHYIIRSCLFKASPAGSLLAVKLHSENGVIFEGKYEILISLILQWQDNPRKTMRNQLSLIIG